MLRPVLKKLTSMFFVSKQRFSSLPQLTQDLFPVSRHNFNKVTAEDVNYFKQVLTAHRVLTDRSDVEPYNMDWLKNLRGNSGIVLKPKSTEEVSQILSYCNAKYLSVCPQGGNTGIVGGSVPVFDEIILSTQLMNKILHLDELSGVLTCESGCILQDVDTYLNNHNMIMPLDLGAKGSCNIGGNVSTNAGGIRLLRYGSLHSNVLGVEVVLSNGKILDLLTKLKKDNTGYHLKHLFIGSEGTLGVVTKISVQCATLPKAVNVAFLGVESFDKVLETYKSAKSNLGEILSSCELIDDLSLSASVDNLHLKHPLGSGYPFYMLIETQGSHTQHDKEKMETFLENMIQSGSVIDGIIAGEPSKINKIWELRERIPEAMKKDGHLFVFDISIPLAHFYELVLVMREKLKNTSAKRISGFGHLGDGNLHFNVTSEEYDHKFVEDIEESVFRWTQKYRGSVSSEHGIGFLKPKFLHYSKTNEAISVMKDIKQLFDPKGILNPYKVLPL